MQWFVDHFYLFICILGCIHAIALIALRAIRRARAGSLAIYLHNLSKNFSSSADIRPNTSIHEQVDTFLTDIREVVHNPERASDRDKLYHRLVAKDEHKLDVYGTRLETGYNVARTGIEIYPLLGILGTIFAIAMGLNQPVTPPPLPPAGSSIEIMPPEAFGQSSGAIIRNFANSIWATASGIGFAIVLMLVNSFIEPGFERLARQKQSVREVIEAAKIHLGISVSGAKKQPSATPEPTSNPVAPSATAALREEETRRARARAGS